MGKGANSLYAKKVKGRIDKTLALIGIILFWWVYIIVAIAIKIEDPKGPVIFKQQRLGQYGKVYWMYKFRSMKVGAEKGGVYSDDHDTRITKVGSRLSTKEQKNLKRDLNTAFCGVLFLTISEFCPYYGYRHV